MFTQPYGIGTATEIKSGPCENLKFHIQDTKHAREPRALVHKRVNHTVANGNNGEGIEFRTQRLPMIGKRCNL